MATLSDALANMISAEELSDLNNAVVDSRQARTALETLTAGGAFSINTRTTLVDVTGTQAGTLADGKWDGQRKSIRVVAAASTPDLTLTPTTFADGTSISLDAVDEEVELEWVGGSGWTVVSLTGATVNA